MYYIHKAPACEALLEKYPHAASYIENQVIVVGESFANHVSEVVDISMLGLQPNDGTEEGVMTEAELDVMVDDFLLNGDEAEVVVSKTQGMYLYEKHKPVVEEDII